VDQKEIESMSLSSLSYSMFFALISFVLLSGCGGGSGAASTGGGGGVNPSKSVTLSFYEGTPSVAAAKIGSGSFTLQAVTAGKLSLSIPSGTTTFSVAYVCGLFEDVFEASTADGNSFTVPCLGPYTSPQMGTLTGNIDISAIPSANSVNLAVNDGTTMVQAGVAVDANFNFSAPVGNDRVEVLAYNSTSQGATVVGVKSFSNQAVPGSLNGGSPVIFTQADQTILQTITYTNVPNGYSSPFTAVGYLFGGAGGTSIATATTQYPELPAAAAVSGDFYEFFATARNAGKPTEMAIVAKSATTAGPMTFAFPAPWIYAGPSPAALPTFDLSYSGFSGRTGVYQTALANWYNPNIGTLEISVVASANYLNGSTMVSFPDLSGLAGFVSPPSSGTQVAWVALIAQSSAGEPQPMSSNATIATVENGGNFTVP
jgi:hypothetical protein